MQNRNQKNYWFIVLAIIIIIVIAIALSSVNNTKFAEREEEIKRRNEEEQKLVKELEELEGKMEIYVKHESVHVFTEKYMNDLCEKRYRQLIQVLIVLLAISNALIIWLVPSMEVLDLFTWNGVAIFLLNLIAAFFFASVKKGKNYLKGIAMNYIEFRVYENRDKNYFSQKVKFYNEEIEKIKIEISKKNDQLNTIRKTIENSDLI